MSGSQPDRMRKAYDLLAQRDGKVVSEDELVKETGWSPASVATYISKKWSSLLTREARGSYRVRGTRGLSWEDFQRIHSQSNRGTLVPELLKPARPGTLTSVEVRNLKSFREASLPLSPVTVLLGANASGKSNFLEGFQLLCWMAMGQSLEHLFQSVEERELSLRGTAELRRSDAEPLGLGCVLSREAGQGSLRIDLAIDWGPGGPFISNERLFLATGDSERSLYDASLLPGTERPTLAVTSDAGYAETTALHPVFTQSVFARDTEPGEAIDTVCLTLTEVRFVDPELRKMRGYSYRTDSRRLRSDGANVSAVLHALCSFGRSTAILELVRALPEQDVLGVDFLTTPRGEVMVQLVECFGNERRRCEAESLSDGTLRVLAMAAALLSAPRGATVVMEEVDNGVHPSRVQELLARIERLAEEQELRVVFTTHNSALLDSLPLSLVPHVVVCYRDPSEGDSRLVSLQDVPSYPELIAQGSLGHLVTEGLLERALKDPTTPEGRVRRGLAWLERRRNAS
jgi:energy-coupling factor transporter ATP-binding protein EcfA2